MAVDRKRLREPDAAEKLLRKVVKCDERDHPNPAAYAAAMHRIADEIRALLAAPSAPKEAV